MIFKKISVYLLIITIILSAGSFITTAMDSAESANAHAETDKNESAYELSDSSTVSAETQDTNFSVYAILSANTYDQDTIMTIGTEKIFSIAKSTEAFYYWQEADIIDFKWLHSFQDGTVTHALFELRGADGKPGHLIYDCVNNVPSSYCASASPYALVNEKLTSTSASLDSRDVYYFYLATSYGFGEIKDNGLIDIYNIMSIIEPVCEEETVLRDVSFSEAAAANANRERVRTVVGSEEAIRDYEARRAEARGTSSSRDIVFPDTYWISGVPDYQQSTGCLCIPTSMANIIGYTKI